MTHDLDAREVEKIAEGLTAAQARVLMQGSGSWNVFHADMRTLPSLNRLGLISRGDGLAMMVHNGRVYANALGIAVRQHLQDRRS